MLQTRTALLVSCLLLACAGCGDECDLCETCSCPDAGPCDDAGGSADAGGGDAGGGDAGGGADAGTCIPDALEPSSAASPTPITVGNSYPDLTLCDEEDVYQFTGTGNSMTVCVDFIHAGANIDVLIFSDLPSGTVVGGGLSTTDDERALLDITAAGSPYYPKVFIDGGGDAVYSFAVYDGQVSCL